MSMMDAVAGTLTDLGGVTDEAEPDAPNSEQTEETPELPAREPVADYNPTVPDEIEMFLAEDDLNLDDDEPVVVPDEYQDPDDLARRLAKAERALEHERTQRIRVSRKSWETEGKKFFPLADLESIQADSRRGFLRSARDQHERNLRILEPQLKRLAASQREADEAAATASRATEAAAWGRPVSGGGGAVPATTTNDERLAAARRRGDLRGSIDALLEKL